MGLYVELFLDDQNLVLLVDHHAPHPDDVVRVGRNLWQAHSVKWHLLRLRCSLTWLISSVGNHLIMATLSGLAWWKMNPLAASTGTHSLSARFT